MSEKYPSKYSNGKLVSAAQYITEMICERKAIKDKTDLHYRFWLQKKWQIFYRNQIASANKLVKEYDPKAVIAALNSANGKKIYSLRAPHLPDMIKYQSELIHKNKDKTTVRKNNIIKNAEEVLFQTSKNRANKNNILSKLKELDNES